MGKLVTGHMQAKNRKATHVHGKHLGVLAVRVQAWLVSTGKQKRLAIGQEQ